LGCLVKSGDDLRQLNAALCRLPTGGERWVYLCLALESNSRHAPYTARLNGQLGNFHLNMGYTIDHLTGLMLVIVTTVAFLVMVYTDGYMAHDPGYVRFYAYLSLFSSSMLGLVVSPNLVQIFFLELVGMCSYLLVGFW